MATKTIADYTAASGIDATADYLLIEKGSDSTYYKISRNTLLGLSSAPLGTTDSQSPTNKTFDNTNTITAKDSLFTLQDNLDTTKQAQFQLSGITTATTRTYTMPNASVTLASLTGTETLTNKTITSPTITGGTYDNGTITVDSIGEHTAANGVTVDGLNIKDGALNTNNSVVAANITASAVTPAKLFTGTGSSWSWAAFSPSYTNLTINNGVATAYYVQIGKTVFFRWSLVVGTTTSFTGSFRVSLPVTAASSIPNTTAPTVIGIVHYEDSGVAAYMGDIILNGTSGLTTCAFDYWVSSTANTTVGGANATNPLTFGSTDFLSVQGCYEAA